MVSAMSSQSLQSAYVMQNSFLNTKLSKKVDSHLSIHGLSFTEYMIMGKLNDASEMTMRRIELAESIAITASGVTRLLAPMEKIGLVEKKSNPRDARVSLVKLSKAGKKLYNDASITFDECSKSLLRPLSERQLLQLTELTNKLC